MSAVRTVEDGLELACVWSSESYGSITRTSGWDDGDGDGDEAGWRVEVGRG